MIEKLQINSTFERVEKSLNLRFQKKGSLFISKNNLEKLKQELFNSNMQNILALELLIKTPIIMQVILKNPWLISDTFLQDKNFKKYIRKNLTADNAKQYLNLLQDIAEDNIFSTNKFKLLMEGFYYGLVDVEECEKIIAEDNSKPKILIECFKRAMIESHESDEIKIRVIDDFFESREALYLIVKSTAYLNEIINTIDDKKYIAQWILDNKTLPKIDPVWSNAFISLGKDSFDVAAEYIKNSFEYSEVTKWIVRNAFQKQLNYNDSNIEYYIEEILSIFKHRDAYRIKVLFLDMLQPGKFKNHEMACRLVDEFERGLDTSRYGERIEKIRVGEEDSRGYSSETEAFDDIDKPSSDTSNQKTLDYISRQFRKTDYSILVQLYVKHNDSIKIKRSISYYIANEMRKKPSSLIKEIGSISDEYVDSIAKYFVELRIDSDIAINFLYKYNKQEELTILLGDRGNDS